jgi:hypothetical protein
MADLTEIQAAQFVKIIGSDTTGEEQTPVVSNSLGELAVSEVPNQEGVDIILTLTTSAQEAKVGANPLPNRKYVEMEALGDNVKWGYNTNCRFRLFKNQFISIPAGPNCRIYLRTTTGTAQVVVGEK